MNRRIRVVHIINSLEFGGAEAMLCNLVLQTDPTRFDSRVISLIDNLTMAGPLQKAGILLSVMGIKPGEYDPRGIMRLGREIRRLRPDVVQTWMDHSNLIGGIATRLATSAPVVWGIHHAHHIPELTKRTTLVTVKACAALSRRLPAKVIFCSEHASKLYMQHGFAANKGLVIPNGFDTTRFSPSPEARASLREELGLEPSTPLVGMLARYDRLKDHPTFLHAAATLDRSVHFVLCGTRVTHDNAELTSLIASLGLTGRCHLLGQRQDVARLHAAVDVVASSSVSEAFPLVLGEAMACGTPCAATDVGDSRVIVGDAGKIVPARDPRALGAAIGELLALSPQARLALSARCRQRVRDRFDLGVITGRYEEVYRKVSRAGFVPIEAPRGLTESKTNLPARVCSPLISAPMALCPAMVATA